MGVKRKLEMPATISAEPTDTSLTQAVITDFATAWGFDSFKTALNHEDVTTEMLNEMRQIATAKGVGADAASMRVLEVFPHFKALKDCRLEYSNTCSAVAILNFTDCDFEFHGRRF